MVKLALCVGIDAYPKSPLTGCEADATAIHSLLDRNEDHSPNFQARLMLASDSSISRSVLRESITELFGKNDADTLVLYFAGHGAMTKNGGSIVAQDGSAYDEGVLMSEIINLANSSGARERIVILDCCHSGSAMELLGQSSMPLKEGVSVLAACRADEVAMESGGRGMFTSLFCSALEGGAADVRGYVSISSAYTFVHDMLSGWEQRALLHANFSRVSPLRRADAAVSDEKLRQMTEYFPDAHSDFPLDPSYEFTAAEFDANKGKIFSVLQQFRAARLVEPVGTEHMYWAAMNSKSCRLTALGKYYWRAVESRKI